MFNYKELFLNNKIRQFQKIYENSDKYILMNSEHYKRVLAEGDYNTKSAIFETLKEADQFGSISKEIGEKIEEILSSGNYRLGIHRSGAINGRECETDEILRSIFMKGLIVNGDLTSGAVSKNISPNKTMVFPSGMLSTILQLKNPYKNSTGAVLALIPSNLIDRDGYIIPGMENEIYDYIDGTAYVKPEFIIGFMQCINGVCCFFSKDDILKNMDASIEKRR